MQNAYVVTGTLTDAQTVRLDEPLELGAVKVRVVVEPLDGASQNTLREVLEEIWEGQRRRGHQPPTREEVDAYLEAERNSWNEY